MNFEVESKLYRVLFEKRREASANTQKLIESRSIPRNYKEKTKSPLNYNRAIYTSSHDARELGITFFSCSSLFFDALRQY